LYNSEKVKHVNIITDIVHRSDRRSQRAWSSHNSENASAVTKKVVKCPNMIPKTAGVNWMPLIVISPYKFVSDRISSFSELGVGLLEKVT
jgi:hypothetical protein